MPSLFDSLKSSLTSATNSAVGSAVAKVESKLTSYSLADPAKLLNEGFGKITSTYGSLGPFSKMAAGAPSFETISAELSLSAGESLIRKGTDFSLLAGGAKALLGGAGSSVATASQIKEETKSEDSAEDGTSHKVKLVASAADGESTAIQNSVNFPTEPLMERLVEFDAMPEVQEIHSVEYEPISAPQMPQEFQKYKGTKSIQWQINGTFTCRTREEAFRNFVYLNNLRGWTKPYFGDKQRIQFGDGGSRGKLGAPPPVLGFSGWRGLVGTVPVVIVSLNWNWPKDCDWLPTGVTDPEGKEIPFPTVMTVNIGMVESYAPNQVNGFDLVAFRRGEMVNAFLSEGEQPQVRGRVASSAEPVGGNGGNQSITNGTAAPTSIAAGAQKTTANIGNSALAGLKQKLGDSQLGKTLQKAWTGAKSIFSPNKAEAKTTPPIPTGDEGE